MAFSNLVNTLLVYTFVGKAPLIFVSISQGNFILQSASFCYWTFCFKADVIKTHLVPELFSLRFGAICLCINMHVASLLLSCHMVYNWSILSSPYASGSTFLPLLKLRWLYFLSFPFLLLGNFLLCLISLNGYHGYGPKPRARQHFHSNLMRILVGLGSHHFLPVCYCQSECWFLAHLTLHTHRYIGKNGYFWIFFLYYFLKFYFIWFTHLALCLPSGISDFVLFPSSPQTHMLAFSVLRVYAL